MEVPIYVIQIRVLRVVHETILQLGCDALLSQTYLMKSIDNRT